MGIKGKKRLFELIKIYIHKRLEEEVCCTRCEEGRGRKRRRKRRKRGGRRRRQETMPTEMCMRKIIHSTVIL